MVEDSRSYRDGNKKADNRDLANESGDKPPSRLAPLFLLRSLTPSYGGQAGRPYQGPLTQG